MTPSEGLLLTNVESAKGSAVDPVYSGVFAPKGRALFLARVGPINIAEGQRNERRFLWVACVIPRAPHKGFVHVCWNELTGTAHPL